MIYLIKSSNYLKVGYSDKFEQRLESYRTSNPDFQVIDTFEQGTRQDEANLHKLMENHLHYGEWFKYSIDVLEIWKNYIKTKVQMLYPSIIPEEVSIISELIGSTQLDISTRLNSGILINPEILMILSDLNQVDVYKVYLYLATCTNQSGKIILGNKSKKRCLRELNITNKTFDKVMETLVSKNLVKVFPNSLVINQKYLARV